MHWKTLLMLFVLAWIPFALVPLRVQSRPDLFASPLDAIGQVGFAYMLIGGTAALGSVFLFLFQMASRVRLPCCTLAILSCIWFVDGLLPGIAGLLGRMCVPVQ